MSDVQETPAPVKAAREAVAAYEQRRGTSRHESPITVTGELSKRRLIFDAPIAVHVTIWLFVGGALVTATTKANAWLGARSSREEYFEQAISAISKRQDSTDAAIRELIPTIRSLSDQVSRLGGIIDSRNKINSTLRGTGGIGE